MYIFKYWIACIHQLGIFQQSQSKLPGKSCCSGIVIAETKLIVSSKTLAPFLHQAKGQGRKNTGN